MLGTVLLQFGISAKNHVNPPFLMLLPTLHSSLQHAYIQKLTPNSFIVGISDMMAQILFL
jgi:hypothetical protein